MSAPGSWSGRSTASPRPRRQLAVPIVSGNVSLYNETPDGPILPTPVVGTVGLVDDRAATPRMAWGDGDELWLLGAPAAEPDALAGSELAWRRGHRGGRPSLDPTPVARLVTLLASTGRDHHGRARCLGRRDRRRAGQDGDHVRDRRDASPFPAPSCRPRRCSASAWAGWWSVSRRIVPRRCAMRWPPAGVDGVRIGSAGGADLRVAIGEHRVDGFRCRPGARLAHAAR